MLLDTHNRALLAAVRPSDWVNPSPAARYNLVVVGGGTAGLVAASIAAGLGAKVALVERALLGGDCLNFGCVPSKTLLRAARALADVREAERYGVRLPGKPSVDFAAVMERVRGVRAAIGPHDGAERFRSLGVDVFLGTGRFTAPDQVVVADAKLKESRLNFARAVIATGARAVIPSVPGLAAAGFLTHETVFDLTELPTRLTILGGGPIGCELAQAFARLGSQVTVLHRGAHLLDKEDADAAAVVQAALVADGVVVRTGVELTAVQEEGGVRRLEVREGEPVWADAVLVATGRTPNVEGLGLEAAGVEFSPRDGVAVDDRMRSTNPRIFAAGDVATRFRFTHAADALARMVIQNALFEGRRRSSALTIPRVTYTDPELGAIGLTEAEADAQGVAVRVFRREFKDVDRARTDGETEGFVKILVEGRSDRIVGASVVGRHAGEILGEIGVAMAGGVGLGRLSAVIHAYPTRSEIVRQCGDAYRRTLLSPRVKVWMERWLRWRRG